MATTTPITRADAVALWHAVEAMKWQLRGMRDMLKDDPEAFTQAQVDAEVARLAAAKVALRKVQAVVRAGRKGGA